jgi:hypothetical protein
LADLLVPFNKGFSGGGRRAQRNIGNSEWHETNRKKDVQFLEQHGTGPDPEWHSFKTALAGSDPNSAKHWNREQSLENGNWQPCPGSC